MGSTNFTVHYDIPLPLGSDKTTPMDYNESMQAVDTALFEAHGNASSAIAGLEITNGNVAQNADDIDALEGRMTTAEGTLVTQGNAINNLVLDVADVRADGQDMITAYKEATAQSTHAYSEGDYFIYNDVLYKTTESIAIGDTIVPDTNCTTTNVTSEIKDTNSAVSKKVAEVTADGVKTLKQLLDELHTASAPYLANLKGSSYITQDGINNIIRFNGGSTTSAGFGLTYYTTTSVNIARYTIASGGNSLATLYSMASGGTTISDISSNVPTAGTKIAIYV